jgi:mannose-6-phosphate isomerase-like protein (cupin superfamily)
MSTKIIKRTSVYLLIAIGGYLAVGYLLHLVIFPEVKPPVSDYFKPNDTFYSKVEGFKQHVEKQENGYVYCSAEIGPLAEGPPKHIHTSFDEEFEVVNGELTLWVDGKIIKIRPGDKVLVPRGTPHKPYNETKELIKVKGSIAFPEKFAYHLTQVYGVMEDTPDFAASPAVMLQMALFNRSGFDSYIAEGPPVVIQKVTGFMLVPLARLLGYKSYYPNYDISLQNNRVSKNNL